MPARCRFREPQEWIYTSWWFQPTHLKNMSQNGTSSPGRGENKKTLKPPPSIVYYYYFPTTICLGNFQNLPSTFYHLWSLKWYTIYVGFFRKDSATKRPMGSPELHPGTIEDMNCHTATRVPTTIPLAPCLWYLWYLIPPWCAKYTKYTKRTSIILKMSVAMRFILAGHVTKRYKMLPFQWCVGREKKCRSWIMIVGFSYWMNHLQLEYAKK